jgi:hypothetical protein
MYGACFWPHFCRFWQSLFIRDFFLKKSLLRHILMPFDKLMLLIFSKIYIAEDLGTVLVFIYNK